MTERACWEDVAFPKVPFVYYCPHKVALNPLIVEVCL